MMPIGTLYNYAKTMQLKQKWSLKQQGVNPEEERFGSVSFSSQINKQSEALTISSITSKLKGGQKLSAGEMEYLRSHAPELYKKAAKISEEREAYRRALNKCKNKLDVQKTNSNKLSEIASTIKSIPSGGSADDMEFVEMRMKAIENEHNTFTQTQRYKHLPAQKEKEKEDENKNNKNNKRFDAEA